MKLFFHLSWLIGILCGCGRFQTQKIPGPATIAAVSCATSILSDDFSYSLGSVTRSEAAATDGSGNIYVVGWTSLNDTRWIVRRSTDGGKSWSMLDDWQPGPGQSAQAFAVQIASDGTIYVGGMAKTGASNTQVLRTSKNGGATWSTVTQSQITYPQEEKIVGIAFDKIGTPYFAVVAQDIGGKRVWLVEKGTNLTLSDKFDGFATAPYSESQVKSIAADGLGNVFAAGYARDALGWKWVVRKSMNSSSTWTTVDTYAAPGSWASAVGIVADSSNRIFAVGLDGKYSWSIRMSTDNGATWSTSDSFQTYLHLEPVSLALDSKGAVYAVGMGPATPDWTYHWVLRKSVDFGASWSVVDNWSGSSRQYPSTLASDSLGNMLVLGSRLNAQNSTNWVTRILHCK